MDPRGPELRRPGRDVRAGLRQVRVHQEHGRAGIEAGGLGLRAQPVHVAGELPGPTVRARERAGRQRDQRGGVGPADLQGVRDPSGIGVRRWGEAGKPGEGVGGGDLDGVRKRGPAEADASVPMPSPARCSAGPRNSAMACVPPWISEVCCSRNARPCSCTPTVSVPARTTMPSALATIVSMRVKPRRITGPPSSGAPPPGADDHGRSS